MAVLLGGVALLYLSAPTACEGLTAMVRYALQDGVAIAVTPASTPDLLGGVALRAFGAFAPFGCGLVLVGLAAAYGQVGFLVTPEAIQPKFSKLDPIAGAKRLFSFKAFMRAVFSMVKLAIIVGVFTLAVRSRFEEFFPLAEARAAAVFGYLCRTVGLVSLQVCAVLLVVALADYGYQRWEHERNLRMTRQELREEMKRMEGDPMVRGRIRQIQREVARRRMMQDVPKADVVVTNPTHYAVALRYDAATMEAPTVVAKGRDRLAEKIKEIAHEHGIALVEDRVLARTLYRAVEVAQEVPYALYQAVARVLTYVFQLRRRQPTRYVPIAEPAAQRGRRVGV